MGFFSHKFFNNKFFNSDWFKQPFFQQPFFNGIGTQKPTGFSNQTVSNVIATGFTINWVKPTGGDPVDRYEVNVTKAGVAISGSPFLMSASTYKKVVTGLTTATEYKHIIVAVNIGGTATTSEVATTTA